MSPLHPRFPVQSQPPYSRVETHGRCVTSWSPLGSRTEAGKKKKKNLRTLPPQTDVRAVQRPASALCKPHLCLEWEPVTFNGCISVHVLNFPSFGCPSDIQRELDQSQGRLEDVYPGGGKCTGCCCYGNAAFCCCCPNLRIYKSHLTIKSRD